MYRQNVPGLTPVPSLRHTHRHTGKQSPSSAPSAVITHSPQTPGDIPPHLPGTSMSMSLPTPPSSSSAISFPHWVGLLLFFLLSSTVWATLYLDPWQSFRFPTPVHQVLETFPFWALVSLGAYALANIGINLIYFNSCPEAAVELAADIREAKVDLVQKGFQMDY